MQTKKFMECLLLLAISWQMHGQDLSQGLEVNDLQNHPMQDINRPAYLDTIVDPAFGTTIRRISDAPIGSGIVPMYSTVQAWNADESLMILYDLTTGSHRLLDGRTYLYLRHLSDVNPTDLEDLFWDFDDPNLLYYIDRTTYNLIQYNVESMQKTVLVNLQTLTVGCTDVIRPGNDVQMMSWDSDVIGFRCGNEAAFAYRISTGDLIEFSVTDVGYVAPNPAPSGELFLHQAMVYNGAGSETVTLNIASGEHSCLGRLANGNDAHFAVAFAEGPIGGGCLGDIIAHDLTTGQCFDVIGSETGYGYPQSGVHISALAHKNSEGGWLCASMMGYDQDGQSLLDQELVIARADPNGSTVCRIAHHRSDEDDFDYWGEPHAVISPSGTRVLFGSDWSGTEDGQSVDSYVVELPSYQSQTTTAAVRLEDDCILVFPNPSTSDFTIEGSLSDYDIDILNSTGSSVHQNLNSNQGSITIDLSSLPTGIFFIRLKNKTNQTLYIQKVLKI